MVGRFGPPGGQRLDRLLDTLAVVIVPFDDHHCMIARDAFVRYGKGRHRAGLNMGDCAAYALAIAEAEPLPVSRARISAPPMLRLWGSEA